MGFSMAEESRKLFVAGLPDSLGEDVLRRLFEDTGGTVLEVSLPRDRVSGRPRGFGFVTMSTSDQANAARQALDGSFQAGRSISVRPFQNEPPRRDGVRPGPGGGGFGGPPGGFGGPPGGFAGGGGAPAFGGGPGPAPGGFPGGGGGGGFGGPQSAPDRTLYVGNLPYDATNEEVEGLITGAGAGPVARIHLPMDPDGRKRGFGFVTMGTAESANAAIEALRGADIRGRRLVVNLAHPKGERPPPREDRGFSPGGPSFGPPGGGPGGGGFAGGENRFGPPAPPGGSAAHRKAHDDRRRRNPEGDGPPGGGGAAGGGGGRRQKNNWDRYATDDDDDE